MRYVPKIHPKRVWQWHIYQGVRAAGFEISPPYNWKSSSPVPVAPPSVCAQTASHLKIEFLQTFVILVASGKTYRRNK